MAQPTAPKTPEQYIASLDDPRRSEIEELHTFIRKTAAGTEAVHRRVRGVGHDRVRPVPYRYASGKEGEWFVVRLAGGKQYISLYVIGEQDGGYIAEAWAPRLGPSMSGSRASASSGSTTSIARNWRSSSGRPPSPAPPALPMLE
jgi:hypothetical protein